MTAPDLPVDLKAALEAKLQNRTERVTRLEAKLR